MSEGRTLARRAVQLWPYLLVAFLYLATSPYHRGLNNPNEMVRLYMTRAWVDRGSFDIRPVLAQWGPVDDKAERDGVLYSSKAPLQSLVGIPGYAASAPLLRALGVEVDKRTQLWVTRVLGSVVFGVVFAWILLAWARKRARELGAPQAEGTALGLVAALGTMLYPYSITFTGHLLAAFAAGGLYLAVVALARAPEGSGRWRRWAVLAGLAGGAAPFAEYPSALVAGPALVAALWITSTWARRAELVAWLGLGGALPFGVGLWAHQRLWGSAFRTGYSFLENKNYVELHGEGFFGVSVPKLEALGGALFSPGTGLFFFSPILIVGLALLVLRAAGRGAPAGDPDEAQAPLQIPRAVAVAGLLGFLFSAYFIAAHRGWRGGWTVGPRYIIAVAPLLWLWVVEALAVPRVRSWIAALGALSVLATGFAAALYPHLSDVYTNPLVTFLLPSYAHGEMTYGLGHALGLTGHAANLVHVLPLTAAMAYVILAGHATPEVEGGRLGPATRRLLVVAGVWMVLGAVAALIPEHDPGAARKENRRLWGFWEPARPGDGPAGARRTARPGKLTSARAQWRQVTVSAIGPKGKTPCTPDGPMKCRYGEHPWQHFGPDHLDMDGVRESILFMHPIKGARIEAVVPRHKDAKTAVLRYGLADASVTSDNSEPVQVTLRQGDRLLAEVEADNSFGLHAVEFTLTSTLPMTLSIEAKEDGARVFGWDLEQYR
ncbi:MAG: hypothetical protein KC933_22495 [Myxococcales bacterium]|nr:hypothetical protein [Myxococcales bacterium]